MDVWTIFSSAALRVIHDHVADSPDVEVGGFMVGTCGDERVPPRCEAAIPARAAIGDVTHLTFTHEAWEHVHGVLDAKYPDLSIIGWYHSHPGHGIFLSEHDLFIHHNFFSAPWQIALVVDPLARTEGVFVWVRGEVTLHSERSLDEHAAIARSSGANAFTQLLGLAPPVEPGRLVVELDDDTPTATRPPPSAPDTAPASDEPTPIAFASPHTVPEQPAQPVALSALIQPEPALTPGATRVPVNPHSAEAILPRRYPVAGHVLPILAGFIIGIAGALLLL